MFGKLFRWPLLIVLLENLTVENGAFCEYGVKNRVGSMGFSPSPVDREYQFLQIFRECLWESLINSFGSSCLSFSEKICQLKLAHCARCAKLAQHRGTLSGRFNGRFSTYIKHNSFLSAIA